jgi:OmpA-OmpF porin, OOP family
MKRAALVLVGSLLATEAPAQGYFGASFGRGNLSDGVIAPLITSGTADRDTTAFKLFGGAQFHRNFGLEIAYLDLGDASYSGAFFGSPVTGGKVELTGFNLSGVASFPASAAVSIFGKLGLFLWDLKASDTTGGLPFATSADGSDLSFGFGLDYSFRRNWALRVEWESFQLGDESARLLSIGIVYRF